MRQTIKKMLSLLLVVVMVCGLLPVSAMANGETTPTTLTFTDGGAEITAGGEYQLAEGATGTVTISTTAKVTLIGGYALDSNLAETGYSLSNLYIDCSGVTGANIELNNIGLKNSGSYNTITFGGTGNVLTITGTNLIEHTPGGGGSTAAICVTKGNALLVNGAGTLYLYKGSGGAGIGGAKSTLNGDITFGDENSAGLKIFAKGTNQGALIGAGAGASGDDPGSVIFNAGTYNLISNSRGAVIGGSAGSSGATGGTRVFVHGGSININVDYSGAAVGGGGYDGGNDASGGTIYVNGGSLRTYIDSNAAGNTTGYNGVAYTAGINDAAVTAARRNTVIDDEPVYKCIFDTNSLETSASNFTVKVDGEVFYTGGLHEYGFVQEGLDKDEQLVISTTPSNWYRNGETNLYLYLTGENHEIEVNDEKFVATYDASTITSGTVYTTGAFAVAASEPDDGEGGDGGEPETPDPDPDPEKAPYTITTAEQFVMLANEVNSGETKAGETYTLGANIDLNGIAWAPIGGATENKALTITSQAELTAALEQYSMVYDNLGNAYKVGAEVEKQPYREGASYYYISGPAFAGTFDGAGYTIENLNVNVSTGYAGLFGNVTGTVKNFVLKGSVTSTGMNKDYVGGVAGKLSMGGTIQGVTSYATVTANSMYNVGGIAGCVGTKGSEETAENTFILECANYGDVTGYQAVGGIAGHNAGQIQRCANFADIVSTRSSGGIGVGGIVGRNGENNAPSDKGTVIDCYNIGDISSDGRWVGGIIGFNPGKSVMKNCYNTGTVSGYSYVNPLIGSNEGTASNSYYLDTTKKYDKSGCATNTYYGDYPASDAGCGPKTEEELKAGEFTEVLGKNVWNMDSDSINNGYPVLKWQGGKQYVKTYTIKLSTIDVEAVKTTAGITMPLIVEIPEELEISGIDARIDCLYSTFTSPGVGVGADLAAEGGTVTRWDPNDKVHVFGASWHLMKIRAAEGKSLPSGQLAYTTINATNNALLNTPYDICIMDGTATDDHSSSKLTAYDMEGNAMDNVVFEIDDGSITLLDTTTMLDISIPEDASDKGSIKCYDADGNEITKAKYGDKIYVKVVSQDDEAYTFGGAIYYNAGGVKLGNTEFGSNGLYFSMPAQSIELDAIWDIGRKITVAVDKNINGSLTDVPETFVPGYIHTDGFNGGFAFNVEPDDGYVFKCVHYTYTDPATGEEKTATNYNKFFWYTYDSDYTIWVECAKIVDVEIAETNGGTITRTDSNILYAGKDTKFNITPAVGYYIKYNVSDVQYSADGGETWNDCRYRSGMEYYVQMPEGADKVLVRGNFIKIPTYTVDASIIGGTVLLGTDYKSQTMDEITNRGAYVKVTPDEGYVLDKLWATYTDAEGNTQEATVTDYREETWAAADFYIADPGASADITVHATFICTKEFSITVSDTENGSVEVSAASALAGTEITLAVTTASGYELDTLTVTYGEGNEVAVTDNAFTMPAADVTVAAAFKLKSSPVTPTPTPTPSPELSGPSTSDMNLKSAVWDGKSIDVSWYIGSEDKTTYTISTAAQFAGVAALVNGLVNEDCLIYDGKTVYTAEEWNCSDYVFDDSGVSGSSNQATAEYHYGVTRFDGQTIAIADNLDMSKGNWMPIGGSYLMTDEDTSTKVSGNFCGVLDGQGHNITIVCDRHSSDLYGDGANIGLVGRLGVADGDETKHPEWLASGAAVRNLAVYGSVKGNRSVGGIVGKIGKTADTAVIENCANFATVTGTDAKGTGGIVGASWNKPVVQNCYNAGSVTSSYGKSVGGISGSNEGVIRNCYNAGTVTANGTTAAIATENGGGSYENCYWLTGSADVGVYNITSEQVVEKTSAEMKTAEFVALLGDAFSADADNTNYGYPVLKWQASAAPSTPSVPSAPGDEDKDEDTESVTYIDVAEDDWFYNAVYYVTEKGLMNGMGEDKFEPKTTTSRAMIVTILYRLEGEPEVTADSIYTDVADDKWYTDAVIWASENKIVEGYGDGSFKPTVDVTREQMAAILYRYASYKGYDVSAAADLSAYTDAGSISAWAVEEMTWANAVGLITGRSDTTLVPKGNANRAEVATMFMRLCETIAK